MLFRKGGWVRRGRGRGDGVLGEGEESGTFAVGESALVISFFHYCFASDYLLSVAFVFFMRMHLQCCLLNKQYV